MRVVIVGATGNVGTSLIEALSNEDRVTSIVGVARRRPKMEPDKTTWVEADIVRANLESIFRGADAVVHLAWLIQPSHNPEVLRKANLVGSERVFAAAATVRVPALIYASSLGAYSPGPKNRLVDESWPTDGVLTSYYSRQKARVERLLDGSNASTPPCGWSA